MTSHGKPKLVTNKDVGEDNMDKSLLASWAEIVAQTATDVVVMLSKNQDTPKPHSEHVRVRHGHGKKS